MYRQNRKIQIGLQRALLIAYTACACLFLVYALGFLTSTYVFFAYGGQELADFYDVMQWVNRGLLWKAVLCIVFGVLLFALELSKYPAGIITLIVTCLVCLATLAINVLTLIELIRDKAEYAALNFSALDVYIERGTISYTPSALTYDLGLCLCLAFSAAVIFLALVTVLNAVNSPGGGK
jgi:hypothetical protein